MSLTREDMLRELELLPVWRLRAPAPKLENIPESISEPASILAEAPIALRMILSDDANFLFLLEAPKSNEEETLLQNMLKAMQVKPHVDISLQGIADLSSQKAKIIIAMGETAANSLLNSAETLENLRGKSHQIQNIPLIVTYHPRHLLANSADKASAWQDLCLARANSLKI